LDSPGQRSTISQFYACDLPVFDQRPNKIATSNTSITINWNEPVDNGGCTIEGYAVYIDDGNFGNFTEANYINETLGPSQSSLEITKINPLNLGLIYRVLV